MLSEAVQIVQNRYPWCCPISTVSKTVPRGSTGTAQALGAYRLWNRVRCPDLIARASFVSMSSESMFAMRTTMSSIAHSSYRTGRTLGGAVSGLTRLGKAPECCPAVDDSPIDAPGPWELRRLTGDNGCGAFSIGGSSSSRVSPVASDCESTMVVACSVGTVEMESPWEACSDWACDG